MSDFLTTEQLSELKTRLENERNELVERLSHQVNDVVAGDANEMADEVDRAAVEETRRLELNRREHDQMHLKKVNAALRRIEEEEYGYCEDCGIEISLKRLMARPESRLCLECQSAKEFSDHYVFRRTA